jgi:flagellar M-ring protein FliF
VGFNAERGDTVEVINMAFAGTPEVEALPEPGVLSKAVPFVGPALRYLLALGVAGLVIMLILRPLVQVVATGGGGGGGRQVQDLVLPQGLPKTVGQLEAEGQGLLADLAGFESEALIPSSREDVLRMAQDNPRQTAEMLKAWMKEG